MLKASFFVALLVGSCLTNTGCVHFDSIAQFQCMNQTAPTAGPVITAEVVDTSDFEVTSLLLVTTKTSNRPPFALSIAAEDPSNQYQALTIREIEVRYVDGSPGPRIELNKSVPFVSNQGEVRRARWVFDDVVPHEADFRVQLRGDYLRNDGAPQPFNCEFHFESDHRYGILPSLVVLNGA